MRLVEPTPATESVLLTSIASNSTANVDVSICFGGIICVRYPTSSLGKAFCLNPRATNDYAPKLELELVTDKSPPSATVKCSE